MSNAPTWKVAVIGAVAVTAGCALVLVNWTVPQLAAFLAMLFTARGALHLVTTSFEGMTGALSALLGLGEVAVGLILLIWPSPTLLVIVVVVGDARHAARYIVLHREWCREFCRVIPECMGVDETRCHSHRGNRHVSGTAWESPRVGESRHPENPKVARMTVRSGIGAAA